MSQIKSKKALELVLGKLNGFQKAKVRDEQYITPSDIAAEVLWKAYFNGDIEDKVIVDLGAGTGILGIGCLILGAKKVIFVDKDKEVLEICKENLEKIESEGFEINEWQIMENDIGKVDLIVDSVIMNPPFGTKQKHADKDFLMKAFEISNVTYSFHKTSTKEYIIQQAEKNKFDLKERFDFKFMLRNTMAHHKKGKEYIEVSCFDFEKIEKK